MSCVIFLMLLIPGAIALTSIIQQNKEENESLQSEASNYRRISYRNNNYNNDPYSGRSYNSYNNDPFKGGNTGNTGRNYNSNNTYAQNNYNRPRLANPYQNQQNEKLSLYFICRAPINIERYNSCIVELIDDHERNMYLLKFQNPINKFKLAKITFNQIDEETYFANKGKTIGQGKSLIKKLRIKFLIGEKPRLEISLPLPFTYCIGIDNPIRYFNVSIHERANKNTNENFNIYITRDEMSIISAREGKNSFETPKKETKQKVISLESFKNDSDEELVNKLFKPDYLKNQKQNVKTESRLNIDSTILNITSDISSSESTESLPSPMASRPKTSPRTSSISNSILRNSTTSKPSSAPKTSSISSSILRDSTTRSSRTTDRRENIEDDIFANAFNKQEQSKSSYEAYKERREQQQKEIEALDEKVELIEEENQIEEVATNEVPTNYDTSFDDELVELVQDEEVVESDYQSYESQEEENPEIYFVTDEEEQEELLSAESTPDVTVESTPEVKIEEPQEEQPKEEISSEVDSVLNKYSKSKPKFKTSSFTSPASSYTTSSYKSNISSYSSNTNKISEKTKSDQTSVTSDFNSKYINKYSKYTKFGA